MLRINQLVLVGKLALPFLVNVTVKNTRNEFTNTAEITIPNKLSGRNKTIAENIKKGSRVVIQLGYFPTLFTVFEGYVSQVMPEKTAVIKCENKAYHVKRQSIGRDIVQKATTLKKLIGAIYNEPTHISDANIGDWKVSKNSTVVDVLSELQNKFKIYSYWRNDEITRVETLIVGADSDPRTKRDVKCSVQSNIPIGESSFNFKDSEADKIVVKATNVNRDGSINEVYAFYSGGSGSQQDIIYSRVAPTSGAINEFNVGGQGSISYDSLKNLARIRLEALSFTGVDGSITIYGSKTNPPPTHGDICDYEDLEIPEKNGKYAIVEVVTRFGVGVGYRHDLGLGLSI